MSRTITLFLTLILVLGVPLTAGEGAPDYSDAPPALADLSSPVEAEGEKVVLYYDDGGDDSPRSGWWLSPDWSYQVRFESHAGKTIKIGEVNFYVADVFAPGTIEVHVQSGLDETFAAEKVEVARPGWYRVEITPGFETDSFFHIVLQTPDFRGGGGDDIHPPTAGRSAQGSPGAWNGRDTNFMVRAVGEEYKTAERKVAVLICGDTPYTARDAVQTGKGGWDGGAGNFRSDAAMTTWGYDEFWGDTVRMYHILIEQGGFHPDNIYVLWGDGKDWSVTHPDDVAKKYMPKYGTMTDYAATIANTQLVFDGLARGNLDEGIPKMTAADSLFVWTFDHGTTSGGGGPQWGDSWLCMMDGNISDYDFADWMHKVAYKRAAVFMQQCFSGGFIDNLADKKTFIATACRGDESAYRADDVNPHPDKVENETWGEILCHHGEFNYYFMNAFEWRSPLGTYVNADTSAPYGRVSSLESFEWEKSHESRWETPQMRDDGNVGTDWILTWRTHAQ